VDSETFLDCFFGQGNTAWPARDPNSPTARFLADYLALLDEDTDAPYILPRNEPGSERKNIYVIPRQIRHATRVREWLAAFVVPSHAAFVQRAEALRRDDPIDNAVAEFVGHRRVYVLEHTKETSRTVWTALSRLRRTIAKRPLVHADVPMPVGRLLAEFDLAMAAGDHRATAELLGRLEGTGLTGMNLAYLTMKRLARLGSHSELLRLAEVRDVVATRPPVPVREAILHAIYSTLLAAPLADADIEAAQQALLQRIDLVPKLADGPLANFSEHALAVIAIAASVTDDDGLWARLRGSDSAWGKLTATLPSLPALTGFPGAGVDRGGHGENSSLPAAAPPAADPQNGEAPRTAAAVPLPESWEELARAVARDHDFAPVLTQEAWRSWPPAADSDAIIADVLDSLDDEGSERAWSIVGAFVDSDSYKQPASRTAQAFLTNALTHNRFRSSDLAGIVALLEIALRGGLSSAEYRMLLDDIRGESGRWVSVNEASLVLDICDVVARAPSPDKEAHLRFLQSLLAPLSAQAGRLEPDQLALARVINNEFHLGFVWTDQGSSQPGQQAGTDRRENVLLYSLDEGALRRVSGVLADLAPGLKVQLSSDHVGSPQLKQWVQRADLVIMATRCATHAATGFIRSYVRPEATVREAQGAGSASLLRAATSALSEREPLS